MTRRYHQARQQATSPHTDGYVPSYKRLPALVQQVTSPPIVASSPPPLRRLRSNSSGKCSYKRSTRDSICGTMRSLCGAHAVRLAMNYQSVFLIAYHPPLPVKCFRTSIFSLLSSLRICTSVRVDVNRVRVRQPSGCAEGLITWCPFLATLCPAPGTHVSFKTLASKNTAQMHKFSDREACFV